MSNNSNEGFLLTAHLYKIPNYGARLGPKKQKLEVKADVDPEGEAVKKKEQTETKK